MNIKHFVITRFLSVKELGLEDKIFDENIIQNGLDYVNDYFIPSMNNQTNKNFEIIFIVNDEHDIENSGIKKLYDIKTDINYHILKDSEYMNFCKNESIGYDWLILTRMDYDDLVKKSAAEEIQNIVKNNQSYDLICYGYNTGYTLIDKKLYKFKRRIYYGMGYFSIFESICTNLKTVNDENIISIYSYTHTALKQEVQNKKTFLNCLVPPDTKIPDNFVWVRHENTGTELLTGNVAPKISSDDLCTIPKNFKDRFGKDI